MSSLSSGEHPSNPTTDLLRETAAARNRHRHDAGSQGPSASGSNPSSLEMPMKWDQDAELARKLQAEEEAAAAATTAMRNNSSKPPTSTAQPASNGRQPAPTAAPVSSSSSTSSQPTSSIYPNLSSPKPPAPSAPYSPHIPIYPSVKPKQERPHADLINDRPPAQVPGVLAPKSASSSAKSSSSLEMPKKYDPDAELARKLQAEEEAAAAARGGGHLTAAAQAERRRREEEDAAMARQLMQKEREALEAAEADERLARDMQAKEEAARNSRARRETEEVDAALARSLQLEEQAEQDRSSNNSPISVPRRSRRHISGDDNDGSDGVVLTDSAAIAREMEREAASERNRRELDELHRRHAERNRLQQAQNSIDALVNNNNNPGGAAASASSSSVPRPRRTREQLIDRLHELQGDYSSFAPDGEGRVTRFRFAPNGRILVNLEQDPNAAPDSEANRRAIAQAATEGIDDEPENMDEDDDNEEQDDAQRAAFEEFEREHQLRQQQPTTLLGVFGNMLHRYMIGRQGMPFTFVASSGNPRPAGLSFRRSYGGGGAASIDVDRLGYEELLALEEALGSVKPRVKAAKEEDLEQLPTRVYKKPAASSSSSSSNAAANNSESVECCICLSEFEEGDMVKTLPCMHQFHEAEIDKWLLTNEKCPTCQRPVTKVD